MPIFWIEIKLPNDKPGDDVNINTPLPEVSNTKRGIIELTEWWQTNNTRIRWDEKTLLNTVNLVNKYLRWSFTLVCTALVIYWGFELITANGDKKALKRAQWTFIGTWVWLAIAMLSYAFVKILTNLM